MLVSKITALLDQLKIVSDWRFAIGVRIRYNNPTLVFQTYPKSWLLYYDKNALLLKDPTVYWGMTNVGVIDWDDLRETDPAGIIPKASEFGLNHGIAVSVGEPSQRTLGFFSSETAPFTNEDKMWAVDIINQIHNATEGILEISNEELLRLRAINNTLSKYRTD